MKINREISQIILAIFICVENYGTSTDAGSIKLSGIGHFHRNSTLPNNCQFDSRYNCHCNLTDLGERDENNATQIETQLEQIGNILNSVVFDFAKTLFIKDTMIREFPETVCRFKQLKQLILKRNKLTTLIPTDCLAGMDYLIKLDLRDNEISYLPYGIFANLSQLRDLYLDNNNISDLSGICTDLPRLSHLSLNHNFLTTVSPTHCFAGMNHLEVLDLRNNDIVYLPDGICANLSQLKYLDLDNNNISDLSRICTNLPRLIQLSLRHNALTTLCPMDCFSGMDYLEVLDLRDNEISQLPNGIFANLSQLKYLYLDNNKISDPKGICTNLPLLQSLRLRNNQISEIPQDCFQHFKKLENLDISCNRVSYLSTKLITPLILIKYINASSNILKSMNYDQTTPSNAFSSHPSFNSLSYIRWMDISRNQLSILDAWILLIAQTCDGCVVDFSYNNITNFTKLHRPSTGRNFNNESPHSITLHLEGNNISHITDMVKGWNLKNPHQILRFVKNKYTRPFILILDSLTCDCQDFEVKKYMIKHDYYNLDLTQAICSAPSNLRNKSFSSLSIDDMVCDTKVDCPSKCICTEQPSTNSMIINCTDGGLVDLPTTLPPLNRHHGFKYNLVLTRNNISCLTYRGYMNDTNQFDISNSSVKEIDSDVWIAFQNMKKVLLGHNLLTHLKNVSFNSLTQMDIQNNPVSCDCDSKWLKPWLESMGDKIANRMGLHCKTPQWLKGEIVLQLGNDDFCSDPPLTRTDVLVITILLIVGISLLSVVLVLLFQTFRFKLYKYTKIHPFDRDECQGEDMDFDVFVTCSNKDEEEAKAIINLLENEGCKVCYHETDFIPGVLISENITLAIDRSKRMLCLLTRNFIESHYCMEEFRMAYQRNIEKGKKRMVLLLQGQIHDFQRDDVGTDVRIYLKRYTCIEMGKQGWENQLMYAMPVTRLLKDSDDAKRVGGDAALSMEMHRT